MSVHLICLFSIDCLMGKKIPLVYWRMYFSTEKKSWLDHLLKSHFLLPIFILSKVCLNASSAFVVAYGPCPHAAGSFMEVGNSKAQSPSVADSHKHEQLPEIVARDGSPWRSTVWQQAKWAHKSGKVGICRRFLSSTASVPARDLPPRAILKIFFGCPNCRPATGVAEHPCNSWENPTRKTHPVQNVIRTTAEEL